MTAEPSLPIDGVRVEHPLRIDKGQADLAALTLDLPVEAGTPPGVAGRAHLLDPNPDRVLIAVGAHLDDALGAPGALALAPERIARAAEIPGLARGNGLAQRLVVHVRDHQHVAGRSISGDAGD